MTFFDSDEISDKIDTDNNPDETSVIVLIGH
jgi:hypothetical protein